LAGYADNPLAIEWWHTLAQLRRDMAVSFFVRTGLTRYT
jgi:hypothetical protein